MTTRIKTLFNGGLLALTIGLLCAGSTADAYFTTVNPAPAGEDSLQSGVPNIMDHIYGVGNWARIEDNLDQVWQANGPNQTVSAQARFAGNNQLFGYFAGDSGVTPFVPLLTTVSGPSGYLLGSPSATVSLSGLLRLGLETFSGATLQNTWSSLQSDNGGDDHMVTFVLLGGISPLYGTLNQIGNYVVAWEDLPFVGSGGVASADRDYNDFVAEIHGITPVPEPATYLGLGTLVAVGILGLSKRKSKIKVA